MNCILDIKSGHAEPWARLQTAAYSLTEESPELEFIEDIHRFQFRGAILPSVTGILKDEGFIDTTWYDDYGRTRGHYVHKARLLDDRGELNEETLDPIIAPYVEAWRKFRRESGFTPIVSEVPMVCVSLLYAGIPDVVGEFPSGSLSRGVVELRNNGTYRLIQHRDHTDIEIWKSIMAVHNWKRNNLKNGGK